MAAGQDPKPMALMVRDAEAGSHLGGLHLWDLTAAVDLHAGEWIYVIKGRAHPCRISSDR
jgi:hypothetical protein